MEEHFEVYWIDASGEKRGRVYDTQPEAQSYISGLGEDRRNKRIALCSTTRGFIEGDPNFTDDLS